MVLTGWFWESLNQTLFDRAYSNMTSFYLFIYLCIYLLIYLFIYLLIDKRSKVF